MSNIPGSITYRVLYSLNGEIAQSRAVIIPGYSTEADIPKIIAIVRGVNPDDITVLTLAVDKSL